MGGEVRLRTRGAAAGAARVRMENNKPGKRTQMAGLDVTFAPSNAAP